MQAIIWDDSSSDDSTSSEEDVNAMALIAQDSTFMCLASADSISMSPINEKSSSENSSEEESDEDDMVGAYQQLVVESKKDLEQERDGLTKAYNSLCEKCSLLEKEKETQVENINYLTKQYSEAREANMEFTKTIIQLKSDLNQFSSGLSKLDKMLGLGQTNKLGLGYERTYIDQAMKKDNEHSTKTVPKFYANPKEVHLKAVKRIIRYVKGTTAYGLLYRMRTSLDLIGYSDADWAGSADDRKSTSGGCFYLGNCFVAWHSKKQNCIALSTAEAEYISAGSCSTQLLWMKSLLSDYRIPSTTLTILYDNTRF
ncbi:uncharacterized protein LOC109714760 [Ananas comosus]|uniref:Uncharacterized protein LOC109714760 n=1 Tax=Ananas comosus TaxID=4615 RepID=A0A6P5FPR6_ANACO|nr:uncharacterized protein LOC109714760 [Ananas comosus]